MEIREEWRSDEKIVGIINFRDFVLVATEHKVYRMRYDELTDQFVSQRMRSADKR